MADNLNDKINSRSIAIVTSTFYPSWYQGSIRKDCTEQEKIDKVRGDLAMEMLTIAKKKNFQIILIDAGSTKEFLKEVAKIGIKVRKAKDKTLSPSRQQGFNLASNIKGIKVICWTEPEKVSIPKDCLPQTVLPILKNQADIIVPKRNKESFATYPAYQVKNERLANKKWNKMLKDRKLLPKEVEELDVYFGPKFFKNDPRLVKIFLRRYEFQNKKLKQDIWSNAIIFPLISSLDAGYRLMSVDIPYRHPQKQTEVEKMSRIMKGKREIQYYTILLTTKLFIEMSVSQRKKLENC